MPDYDEFGMSYKDRSALSFKNEPGKITTPISLVFNRMIVLEGKIVGSWRRTLKGKTVAIETDISMASSKEWKLEIANAVDRYCSFIGRKLDKPLFTK